ncbi:MAG TPA: tetratricopeptide repeat protein [Candidatus Binatus sp.]|uniref:tetratricopeptide repeat protein n=1 Tax=Candidatus Binatus sp. TaxID=2811406 RepID=UPI002F42C4DF
MSASDKQAPPRATRSRARRTLVIRRVDHVGDPVGLAFLESPETNGDALLERIREYLGNKLRLVKAEVSHGEITVEVESRGWTEEGTRMAAVARDLYEKGARRSALAMYRDALDLDPLNAEAMLRLGLALAEQEKFADALAALKHAREFGAGGVELLVAMGRCASGLDRAATAIAYYEEALNLEPRNFIARRALAALGHKPVAAPKESSAVRTRRD